MTTGESKVRKRLSRPGAEGMRSKRPEKRAAKAADVRSEEVANLAFGFRG